MFSGIYPKKDYLCSVGSYLKGMSNLQVCLCREPTRTLNKNQEEPFAVAEVLTLEAAIPLG
jgi:hypothetical protein